MRRSAVVHWSVLAKSYAEFEARRSEKINVRAQCRGADISATVPETSNESVNGTRMEGDLPGWWTV